MNRISLKIACLAGVAAGFMLMAAPAWAALGDHSAQIEKDAQFFHGKLTIKRPSSLASLKSQSAASCYSVADVESNGVDVREYVNTATDTVFMIRANSRILINVQKLMGTTDYTEYKNAIREHNGSFRFNHRARRAIGVDTDNLKIRFEGTSLVHRALMIQKSLIPSCVVNPEALP